MCEGTDNSPVTGIAEDQTTVAGRDVIQTCHLHFTYAAKEKKCLPDGLGGCMALGTLLRVGYNRAGTLVWSYSSPLVCLYKAKCHLCVCVSAGV